MAADLTSSDALLRLRGLGKSRQDGERQVWILRELELTLARGEIVAVIGPSGSGKTTLLNIIAGLDDWDEGSVQLAGIDTGALKEAGRTQLRRRHLGFVFQFFNLIPTLTARENCLLPQQLNGALDAARIDALLARVGIDAVKAARLPGELSGGEQQRVALVRALAHRPALVLADEPTGNLDAGNAAVLADLLWEQLRAADCGALLVTHSLALAARADRILQLDGGRLVPAGAA